MENNLEEFKNNLTKLKANFNNNPAIDNILGCNESSKINYSEYEFHIKKFNKKMNSNNYKDFFENIINKYSENQNNSDFLQYLLTQTLLNIALENQTQHDQQKAEQHELSDADQQNIAITKKYISELIGYNEKLESLFQNIKNTPENYTALLLIHQAGNLKYVIDNVINNNNRHHYLKNIFYKTTDQEVTLKCLNAELYVIKQCIDNENPKSIDYENQKSIDYENLTPKKYISIDPNKILQRFFGKTTPLHRTNSQKLDTPRNNSLPTKPARDEEMPEALNEDLLKYDEKLEKTITNLKNEIDENKEFLLQHSIYTEPCKLISDEIPNHSYTVIKSRDICPHNIEFYFHYIKTIREYLKKNNKKYPILEDLGTSLSGKDSNLRTCYLITQKKYLEILKKIEHNLSKQILAIIPNTQQGKTLKTEINNYKRVADIKPDIVLDFFNDLNAQNALSVHEKDFLNNYEQNREILSKLRLIRNITNNYNNLIIQINANDYTLYECIADTIATKIKVDKKNNTGIYLEDYFNELIKNKFPDKFIESFITHLTLTENEKDDLKLIFEFRKNNDELKSIIPLCLLPLSDGVKYIAKGIRRLSNYNLSSTNISALKCIGLLQDDWLTKENVEIFMNKSAEENEKAFRILSETQGKNIELGFLKHKIKDIHNLDELNNIIIAFDDIKSSSCALSTFSDTELKNLCEFIGNNQENKFSALQNFILHNKNILKTLRFTNEHYNSLCEVLKEYAKQQGNSETIDNNKVFFDDNKFVHFLNDTYANKDNTEIIHGILHTPNVLHKELAKKRIKYIYSDNIPARVQCFIKDQEYIKSLTKNSAFPDVKRYNERSIALEKISKHKHNTDQFKIDCEFINTTCANLINKRYEALCKAGHEPLDANQSNLLEQNMNQIILEVEKFRLKAIDSLISSHSLDQFHRDLELKKLARESFKHRDTWRYWLDLNIRVFNIKLNILVPIIRLIYMLLHSIIAALPIIGKKDFIQHSKCNTLFFSSERTGRENLFLDAISSHRKHN